MIRRDDGHAARGFSSLHFGRVCERDRLEGEAALLQCFARGGKRNGAERYDDA
jgi:hypothetical protein